MNFLTKTDPLDFGEKKCQGFQYYQWKHKQRINQQEEEEKRLEKMYERILNEEAQTKTKRTAHQYYKGTFYDYNIAWKKKIDERIKEQKLIMKEEKDNIQKEQLKKWRNKSNVFSDVQYKGPIKGWDEHFQNYLYQKSNILLQTDEQATFEPQINEKSKLMTRNFTEKVEDRLIRFGLNLKRKKKQQSIINATSHNKTSISAVSDNQLFIRLHEDGQKANRKRIHTQTDCPFKPTINQISQKMEKKVQEKRKPLYHIKDHSNMMENSKIMNTQKKGSFQNFLQRNEALLANKMKNQLKFKEEKIQREKNEENKCTFSPKLNKNSAKIFKNKALKEEEFEREVSFNLLDFKQTERMPNKLNHDSVQESSVKYPQKSDQFIDSLEESDSISKYQAFSDVKQEDKSTQRKSNLIKSNVLLFQQPVREQDQEEQQIRNYQYSTINKYEPDSIEKMKDDEWQTQLQQVEDQLEMMMVRAREGRQAA